MNRTEKRSDMTRFEYERHRKQAEQSLRERALSKTLHECSECDTETVHDRFTVDSRHKTVLKGKCEVCDRIVQLDCVPKGRS